LVQHKGYDIRVIVKDWADYMMVVNGPSPRAQPMEKGLFMAITTEATGLSILLPT